MQTTFTMQKGKIEYISQSQSDDALYKTAILINFLSCKCKPFGTMSQDRIPISPHEKIAWQCKLKNHAESGSQWIFYAHHINQSIHMVLTIELAAAIAPILMKENDILHRMHDLTAGRIVMEWLSK